MKTALITGANKGIGYEAARQLAAKGFHVFLGARNPQAGRKAVQALGNSGAKTTFIQLDVTGAESVTAAAREFAKFADHLDVLVNNAGILFDGDSAILEVDVDLVQKTLETNTLGPLRVAQAFAPMLTKSSAPRIINVSSGGGQLTDGADGWAPAYCISKTALNGVTSQLASALPKFAVTQFVPAESALIWGAWVRRDRSKKARIRSCGSRPRRRKILPPNSFATVPRFRGEATVSVRPANEEF
jgi:NAD(P)-dependent dehydrogenase (short-subunit alcohol dehydrogenase family)